MPASCQIREAEGSVVDVTGYIRCRCKTVLSVMGYVLTFGILRIIFHWFPHIMLKSTHRRCSLHEAQRVLLKDSCGVYHIEKVSVHKPLVFNDPSSDPYASMSHESLLPSGLGEGEYLFFVYKKMKYLLMSSSDEFILLPGWEDRPLSDIIHSRPLTQDVVERSTQLFGLNEIKICLTPLVKLLLTECLSPFYCFQVFSCVLWFYEEYELYAACILVVSTISLCTEVYEIRRNERAVKQTVGGSSTLSCCRVIEGITDFRPTDSIALVPGDVIEIPKNGFIMQCDALLLTGSCIVNESTLTGESVPVTKTAISGGSGVEEAFSIKTHARHVLFSGTSVIQTRNYADERVVALVLRTGFHTTKGELVRCILYPKPMRFKFTQDIHKVLLVLAMVAAVGFGYSIYLMIIRNTSVNTIITRALDIVTIVVPPALPAAMTAGIVFAQRRLRQADIYCINPSVINVCSAINVVCFDKTGTLTEDGLDLWGVVQCEGGAFNEAEFDPSKLQRGPLLEAMATCHSLTHIEGILSGDPLDLKMFQSTKWELIEEVSEDHCKFEMAVPAIVRPLDCGSVSNLTVDTVIDNDMFPYEVGIIRQFPFTSGLQRMSVVARVLNGSHFSVYTKGAPETIESLCRSDTIPMNFHSTLLDYTREGYRVLAIAWRPLKIPYTRIVRAHRDQVERDLQFLGLVIMENRLKPETAPVISEIIKANIRPIMVTGDNMLTALSVARDCEMIDELDRIIIVSAKPPPKSVSGIECAAGGDAGRSLDNQPSSFEVTPGPSTYVSCLSTDSTVPVNRSTSTDNVDIPLVEFHYAEDLHKPVTEVTTTTHWPYQAHNTKRRPQPNLRVPEQISQSSFHLVNDPEQPIVTCDDGSHAAVVFASDYPDGSGLRVSSSRYVTSTKTDLNTMSLSHPLSICMLDRPDFHLAISGKMWAIINEHYPWLIPKLVVKGAVFARFSPDQKAQLVEALQSVGYFVAMCGDGANDCGALKAAHAGISLSEAEASVASPFTSKQQNISCVPTLIREGRCALATSFGIFKFMIGYSLLQFFSVTLVYLNGTNLSTWQYVYIDFFLLTTLGITFGFTRAYRRLSVEPPTIRLLSFVTMMSLTCQILISLAIQLLAFLLVQYQPWYFPVFNIAGPEDNANYENTVVFIVSSYQYIILAIAFSKGSRYRRSLITNIPFVINLVVCFGCTVVLTTYPFDKLLQEFELLRLPSARFIVLLHTFVLTNFLLSWLLELILDGVAFRRRILHMRRALFPKLVQRKVYEHIRDELDRMAGVWPPIIRSASVQALPRDLFTDGNAPDTLAVSTRQRKRNISSRSEDTDGSEFSPVRGDDEPLVTINVDSVSKEKRRVFGSPSRRHSSHNVSMSMSTHVSPGFTTDSHGNENLDVKTVKEARRSGEQIEEIDIHFAT